MRRFTLLLLCACITACGGGGGGSSPATPEPPPEPTNPDPEPTSLTLLDALPASGVNADPQQGQVFFAHLGHSDLEITLSGDCTNFSGTTLRRQLFDLAQSQFDQLLDHRVNCDLTGNSTFTFTADGTRSNDAAFRAQHTISTTTASPGGLLPRESRDLPRSAIDNLFAGYVRGALMGRFDLAGDVESALLDIAGDTWEHLTDPEALYDVRSERVSYLSSAPDGSPDMDLTGLIAYPVTASTPTFTARDKMLVLMHATGSTPSDQNPADAWFILANQFAARGYLVIAPDNYGRGGTGEAAETYLMANRTARNAHDLLAAVQESSSYDAIYDGNAVTIIGYSQGGHSAMALYQHLVSHDADLDIREVYAGGAPHDLYRTFYGILQFADGTCDDNDYCRYVDDETTVPFVTDRVLPAVTAYTDVGLELSELVAGERLSPSLVTGFLANEAAYDPLKIILQLNSLTNLVSASTNYADSSALVHLYHSEFDRLVPHANTQALDRLLRDVVNVDFHENRCNSGGYEAIFNLTDRVGVLHTLCGLSVLNDIFEDLR